MKKAFFLSLIAILFLPIFIGGEVLAKYSFTEQIIKENHAMPMEYGASYIFEINDKGKTFYEDIIKSIGHSEQKETNSWGEAYRIRSKDNALINVKILEDRGEIEFKSDKKENFNSTKIFLSDIFLKKNLKVKNYEYVKCAVQDNNLDNIYSKTKFLMLSRGGKNLEGIPISNGYSITALMGIGKENRTMGNFTDVNIAIVCYESGSWLIIGTPEIMTAY